MHSDQGVARILCSRIADGKDIGGPLVKTFVKVKKIGNVYANYAHYLAWSLLGDFALGTRQRRVRETHHNM